MHKHQARAEARRRPPNCKASRNLYATTRVLVGVAAVLAVLAVAGPTSRAEPAESAEMDRVCLNWLTERVAQTGGWGGAVAPQIRDSYPLERSGRTLARVYRLVPEGFVIVAGLKELPPVIAYSDRGELEYGASEGLLEVFTDLLESRFEFYDEVLAVGGPADPAEIFAPRQRRAWDRLAVSVRDFRPETSAAQAEEVGPLMTTAWHQNAPYNNSCPLDGYGQSTAVGCGAIAAAQIMAYWQWPLSGVGSRSYVWQDTWCTQSGFADLLVDLSDSYDWDNMPDDCNAGCTPAQEAAAADFCYEVAVAFHSEFGSCGTVSPIGGWEACAPRYFKYAPNCTRHLRYNYTEPEWFDLLRTDLDQARIVKYDINSHAIVCDGYRTDGVTDEVHMNYGWGGASNAWYVVDELYCYWMPGEVCPYEQEQLVTNIYPMHDPILEYYGATLSETGGDGDGAADAGETVQLDLILRNKATEATGVSAEITTSDPYLFIGTAVSAFDLSTGWGQTATGLSAYEVSVDPGCPDPHVALIEIGITCDGGYAFTDSMYLFVGDTPGFEDDVESGPGAWSHSGMTIGYRDDWHITEKRTHSGLSCWNAGGEEPYPYYSKAADGFLVSPPFMLPAGGRLTYWQALETSEVSATTAYDGAIVNVVLPGGQWEPIEPVGGYTHYIQLPTWWGSHSPFEPGSECFSGFHLPWQEIEFDLSHYEGVIQLAFRFGSNTSAVEEGWYVDDVWVGNTPTGSSVAVVLDDNLEVSFDEVTGRGITALTEYPGLDLPAGCVAVAGPCQGCFNLSTTATFGGDLTLAVSYDESALTAGESALALMHHDGASWIDITGAIDAENDRVFGTASSLSPFVLVEKLTCCEDRVGDANGSGEDEPTIGDVTVMIDALFIAGDMNIVPCLAEADINGSGGGDPGPDDITIGDVSYLIDYLFITGTTLGLPDCF